MTAQQIAREIEAARYEAGMSVAELCRRAGVTYLSYWRAQDGQGSHYDTINALAEAAGFEIVLREKEDEDARLRPEKDDEDA